MFMLVRRKFLIHFWGKTEGNQGAIGICKQDYMQFIEKARLLKDFYLFMSSFHKNFKCSV